MRSLPQEGSSFNKAIEIYNPTRFAVGLDLYVKNPCMKHALSNKNRTVRVAYLSVQHFRTFFLLYIHDEYKHTIFFVLLSTPRFSHTFPRCLKLHQRLARYTIGRVQNGGDTIEGTSDFPAGAIIDSGSV